MDALPPARRLRAPAKVNLALHVTGRRGDGYHLLDSLVVFAKAGDELAIRPGTGTDDRVSVRGPFAAQVPEGRDNIVARAVDAARRVLRAAGRDLPPLDVTLDKRLPVASGIGGGSADAAAVLAYAGDHAPACRAALAEAGLALGADVPMCLAGRPCRVRGIGEIVEPLAAMPQLPLLLANPGIAVSTPAVFRGLAQRENPPLPDLPAAGFSSPAELAAYLRATRNDLEAAALALAPDIARVTDALLGEGALFARMSGSGASVAALFGTAQAASAARAALAARHPGWWLCESEPALSPSRIGATA
ncbi:4-(cytidine 5'-diphospho)-2-C-methyl-D-erythritol kinase [Aurantimonas sp. Leaf443]|uniref:4-(cytidine 5'-diphospho)-2-C-methyl-D-erythritol kinase n=1 Tax=Aurantimonas sp. Leaf443 TaxID=1736378 RepID=UPI0006F4EFE8|nr:4-(cytidine 5'-diphospho)-2-C-methyl-D-erythritol kinase [Aurantimonas sp. Leaf443]KQT88030.1 4-diphosphocytidyl-2C-methyl-D-erythritol kinase [Aurantimonas sp. Leaf443]